MASIRPKIRLHDFGGHLVCPNCRDLYDNPQLLPCLDSVCERCVNAHPVEVEQPEQGPEIPHENFHCPRECCEKQYTTNAQAQNVVSNRFLANLVETFKLEDDLCKGKRVACDACGERESAVVVCLHEACRKKLCQTCREYHERELKLKNHPLLEVGRLCHSRSSGATQLEAQDITRKAWFCHLHGEQQICMYCPQHKEVTCPLCGTDNHRECPNLKSVERLFIQENPLPKMQQTIQQVQAMNNEVQQAMEHVNTIKEELRRNERQVKESIDNRYEEVVRQLTEQQERLKEQATVMCRVKAELLDNQLEVLDRVHRNVAHSLRFIEDSVDISTKVEFYFLKCPFERRMDELKSILNDTYKDPLENIVLRHDVDDEDENIRVCAALGNVHSNPTVSSFTVENNGGPQLELEAGKESGIMITCNDAGGSIVKDLDIRLMPSLQAKLVVGEDDVNPVEVQDAVFGSVKVNTARGMYLIQVVPQKVGAHRLYVYLKRPDPYGIELINGGQPINVMVVRNMSALSMLPFSIHV